MKDPRDIFGQFSAQAKKILTASQQVAETMQSGIGSEHMLIALAVTPQTLAYELLKEYAITLEQVRLVLSLNNLWTKERDGMSEEAKAIVTVALRTAVRFHHEQIEAEHLLYAMTVLRESRAYQVIARVGVDPAHIKGQLEGMLAATSDLQMIINPDLLGSDHDHEHDHLPTDTAEVPLFHESTVAPEKAPEKRDKKGKILETFTVDMTKLADSGTLDPLIGRDHEVDRVIHILARRTKNNPVLIGEPGVGKTAIVEGLANRIVSRQVPAVLFGKRILRLDLALLVAGTMYRGQFEERLKKVIDEVTHNTDTILFIDELHTIVGTGSAEGSLDAANMLKPAMARGQLRLIGATTLEEYRRFIEKDAALERRFQPITVDAPNIETTLQILQGLKPIYEQYHEVRITDEALSAAANLATRYIHDKALPDTAIDLIDEAAAAKKIATPSKKIRELERLTDELSQLSQEKEHYIEEEAFSKAAAMRNRELSVRAQLKKLERPIGVRSQPMLEREDIIRVVAQKTNIPAAYLMHEVTTGLKDLFEKITGELIDQDEAVHKVVRAIKRAGAGLHEPGRPMGSFLFLGPTGVGKTELGRILARHVFGRADAFIKLDMSEFMEKHTVARLVGAPPGYVGYEDAGKLTEAVRRRPYCLLLLDEIEKAHPEVQNILLQILEDGVLTDAKGRRVDFSNTIIIMTSNLGTRDFNQIQAIGFHKTAQEQPAHEQELSAMRTKVLESIKEYFKPEFLNRLDGVVVFAPLQLASIKKIVDRELKKVAARMLSHNLTVTFSKTAKEYLAEHGFDQEYGARPIKRLITETIEDPIAADIIDGRIQAGDTLTIDGNKNGLLIQVKNPQAAS